MEEDYRNLCQVFTPIKNVKELLDWCGYKHELYGKKIIENSCGDGNILKEVVKRYIDDCIQNGFTNSEISKGLENVPEKGIRCHKCYRLRLDYTACMSKENNFDYFSTTLTVSPYKLSNIINEIGLELERVYGVKYLVSDFKKNEGYKRSIELSNKYNLYRQNYCGCIFSKKVDLNE